ncbi:MAG: hypothetical protein AVDCRST_MAG74-1128 [uncultured Pyrinomonadaceae bacterium]|uniref:Uncharacterized protein n=1 Tax=uncultured Pyrinomonadaceae bacterium TaxID=2283094 RepID=A0A6J4NP12_9BACT|nr:MAG: hypothetical protein AVDCRST_MAG74-1128 [uncultured Pyrinomonadaceae bacterium]
MTDIEKSKNESNKPQKKTAKNSETKKRDYSRTVVVLRSFFASPIFNVAALVLLFVAVFGGLRLFSGSRNPAQVSFVERPLANAEATRISDDRILPAPEIFKGEVYQATMRLRETAALGMAISLVVFAEYAERGSVPANLERIVASISERGLMPPGLETQNGEIFSPESVFVVRYQSQPLRFEIVSRPKEAGSPALLLRFPLRSLDGRTITYFQSKPAVTLSPAPEPFAALDKLVAGGWTMERWRGEMVAPNDKTSVQILAEEKRLLSEFTNNR